MQPSPSSLEQETPRWEIDPADQGAVRLLGRWTVSESAALEAMLHAPLPPGKGRLVLDAAGITALDTAGAIVLQRLEARLREAGRSVESGGLQERQAPLLEIVTQRKRKPLRLRQPPAARRLYGHALEIWTDRAFGFLSFFGEVFVAALRQIAHPHRIRWGFVVRNIQTAGADALPIIGLLMFLIGVVVAYQGAVQLHRYGADIFIVDLVGLSMVRELAPLFTAILVAGRTGSAYTAQIGTMRVTEEVDALRVLALSPIDVLVLPKVFALVIALPLLTAFADLVGVVGGILMTATMMPIGPRFFLEQFPRVVEPQSYFVGIGKAPVFAVVIATVGCYQGFRASGSAESVGAQTTISVVQSIFLIIVLDALFSVVFSELGI
ncbi:MAG TPA: MlaE family lipid ABC transporter permease subunit [bacterium]|nr:MlaE family lipid ABC transporter permease subunit [bacterium]